MFCCCVSSICLIPRQSPRPQLGQLEVALREHKQEMQKKVESLQQSLQARERELTDRHMKVRSTHRIRRKT